MLDVLDRGKNFCLCRSLRREGMAALSGLERQPFWPVQRKAMEINQAYLQGCHFYKEFSVIFDYKIILQKLLI